MELITASKNERIKRVKQLISSAKARRESGLFVAEGKRICEEAPSELLKEVYISEHYSFPTEKSGPVPVFRVKEEVFSSMTDTRTPQGVLMVLSCPAHRKEGFFKETGLYLFLETIQDPGNLGTIIRTAEAAGADGIVMNRECADLFSPKTIRSTMGSIFRLPFLLTEDFPSILSEAKEAGIRLFAGDLDAKRDYTEETYRAGTGFLIGNEGNGLSEETKTFADQRIRIPMGGEVDSLNAAVAAAVLLFEAKRQRV